MLTEKAKKNMAAMLRQAQINCASNSDVQALEVASLYPDWAALAEGTTLEAGQRVNYEGVLYNVLQTHQKQATWTPAAAPSLFAQVLITDDETILEWVQPESTNGYMTGDKVAHNGSIWESLVDNNVWEPGAEGTESVWKEVTE